MSRHVVGSIFILVGVASFASGQGINRNGFGGNGLGNAGGFATGTGFSNSTTNSNNFGTTLSRNSNYGAAGPGVLQNIPGVSNYGGGMQPSFGQGNLGTGSMPAVGNGMGPGAMNGIVPGIAPPGFTRDMFGYDTGVGGDSGYTNFGNAVTASALGLGFGGPGYGGLGYGGLGYGGMGYGPLGYGAMGYSYPGMAPGTFMPGVGYISPADFAAASGIVAQPNANQTLPPALNLKTTAGATLVDSNEQAGNAGNRKPDNSATTNRTNNDTNSRQPTGGRRSFLNDNVPLATANAIRIQNRLHNVKSPNLKNIRVLIANRTALLSGTVDSTEDEKLALRMVALEPGVVEVKSEVTVQNPISQ